MRRIFLEQFDIAEQSAAGVTALDQVMTENAVFGKTSVQGLFKRVHAVDALANERALQKQVLINVRNRTGVGVDAGITAE
ncbi:hypothetical protein D3C81_397960 [compost metagenome]